MKSYKLPTKITIIQDKSVIGLKNEEIFGNSEYFHDCVWSHIVAVKQPRGYKIVKHRWEKTPITFKNKQSLLEHISKYM